MSRGRVALGVIVTSLCALLAPVHTLAASLTIVGETPAKRSIELSRAKGGGLEGELVLLLTGSGASTPLHVGFHQTSATSDKPEVTIALTAKQGSITRVVLRARVPPGGEPEALHGLVTLGPKGLSDEAEAPVSFEVTGVGSGLRGVAVEPSALVIHATSWLGPFAAPTAEQARVQLSGPGVPALFAAGLVSPAFHLRLRTGSGHELRATLRELKRGSYDPDLATAEIEVAGGLTTGKYEGSAPISDLSPGSPKLSVVVEAGHSFLWPLLATLLGAIIGGALYLVSGRSRRKALMRNRAKSLVSLYKERCAELPRGREGELQMWTLDAYLGSDWYTIRWSPIVQIDGAFPAIWSNIHWARGEADLDAVSKEVDALSARVLRWVTTATSLDELLKASALQPESIKAGDWGATRALADTEFLLQLALTEPTTEEAASKLVDRIARQAHWHKVLARAFNAKAIVNKAMSDAAAGYDADAVAALRAVDLAQLDAEASPESGRDVEKQARLERQLARCLNTIRGLYKGSDGDLEIEGLVSAVYTAADSPGPVAAATELAALPAARARVSREHRRGPAIDRLRGESAFDDEGARIPASVAGVLRRDLAWTVLTAVVSSAAYVPTIYSATWGSFSDYVTAFGAGFLGKVLINWGALPAFQSVRSSVASAGGKGDAGG